MKRAMSGCDHLRVLELEKEGDWEAAHAMVQVYADSLSCLIHGYLHRVEGDLGNASYWYGRGDSRLTTNPLPDEWQRLHVLATDALNKSFG